MNVPILPTLKGNSPEEIRDWAQSLVNALVYELSNLTAGKVSSTTYVVDGVIGTDQLANDAVTNAKVADVAIDTAQLVDAAITTGKIADANVSTEKLANLAVDASKLAGATTGTQINVGGIASGVCSTTNTQGLANGDYVRFGSGGTTSGGYYLVSGVVANTSFTIDDATITDATAVTCYEATEGAITYEKIANLAVGHTAIAAAAIGTAHIANLAVTEALIANLAVVSAKIGNLAVEEGKINSLAVTEGKIGALAVTNAKIKDCAVDKLTAGSITSKAITLAISAGIGDVKIQAGKTDFGSTDVGFILGMDDSDSDLPKFELYSSATNYLNWNGATLSIRGSINADDITAGTITGRTLQTASSGARWVTSVATGLSYWYGDRGDGTVELLGTFGGDAGSGYMINLGTINMTNFGGVKALSLRAATAAIYGACGTSDAAGVWGQGIYVGGYFTCNRTTSTRIGYSLWADFDSATNEAYLKAPLRLTPSSSALAPSHSADVGALWVTSAGVLYINTDGSTTWAKVGAQ